MESDGAQDERRRGGIIGEERSGSRNSLIPLGDEGLDVITKGGNMDKCGRAVDGGAKALLSGDFLRGVLNGGGAGGRGVT